MASCRLPSPLSRAGRPRQKANRGSGMAPRLSAARCCCGCGATVLGVRSASGRAGRMTLQFFMPAASACEGRPRTPNHHWTTPLAPRYNATMHVLCRRTGMRAWVCRQRPLSAQFSAVCKPCTVSCQPRHAAIAAARLATGGAQAKNWPKYEQCPQQQRGRRHRGSTCMRASREAMRSSRAASASRSSVTSSSSA